MTGYCEPNSLGGRLMKGSKEVSIFVVNQWLAGQDPRKVKKLFLVHGEYEVQQAFKDRLLRKGYLDIEIPARHYEVGLG
jgi:metallo-beta-lactamase family protein